MLMKVGDVISITGCFTKEKFIAGRKMDEIERILGFRAGRFSQGITVATLVELPDVGQFELAGYSNVATHRHAAPTGLDIGRIKAIARSTWSTGGFERLVKVLPALRHDKSLDPDIQYPPGLGAPQWIAMKPLRAKVVCVITGYPASRYQVPVSG